MSKKETTIRIGDTVIVKNKVVSYELKESNKKILDIRLDGNFIIRLNYETEKNARENFDEFNKLMKEYLDHED